MKLIDEYPIEVLVWRALVVANSAYALGTTFFGKRRFRLGIGSCAATQGSKLTGLGTK
jgi:hypothetical protein